MFDITIANNKHTEIVKNTFFKCSIIQYSSLKSCQLKITYVSLMIIKARLYYNLFFFISNSILPKPGRESQ